MMRETDRDTLRKHRERLQKDLGSSEVDRIASGLYSKKIFSVEDKDEVTAKSTGFAKSDLLLDKLPRKGHDAFGVFCEVLRGVSPHLEQLLRPSQEDGVWFLSVCGFCVAIRHHLLIEHITLALPT